MADNNKYYSGRFIIDGEVYSAVPFIGFKIVVICEFYKNDGHLDHGRAIIYTSAKDAHTLLEAFHKQYNKNNIKVNIVQFIRVDNMEKEMEVINKFLK